MKKINFKIVLILFGFLLFIGVTFAINTISEGFKINKNGGTSSLGDPYYYCFQNNNTSYDYFIPTNTSTEFNSFNSYKPNGVSQVRCRPDFLEEETSWVIRYKNLDRTTSYPTCGTLPINYLFVDTPFGNYTASNSTASTLESITQVTISGRIVYKGPLYSDDIGQCSPYSGNARKGWKVEY